MNESDSCEKCSDEDELMISEDPSQQTIPELKTLQQPVCANTQMRNRLRPGFGENLCRNSHSASNSSYTSSSHSHYISSNSEFDDYEQLPPTSKRDTIVKQVTYKHNPSSTLKTPHSAIQVPETASHFDEIKSSNKDSSFNIDDTLKITAKLNCDGKSPQPVKKPTIAPKPNIKFSSDKLVSGSITPSSTFEASCDGDSEDVYYLTLTMPNPESKWGPFLSTVGENSSLPRSDRFEQSKISFEEDSEDLYERLDSLCLSDAEQPDWDSSLSEAVSSSPSKPKEISIAEEIYDSEKRYLGMLKILQTMYVRLMERLKPNPYRSLEITSIFKHIESLLRFHEDLTDQLSKIIESGKHMGVSKLFLSESILFPLKMYKPFIADFERNQLLLLGLLRNDPEFEIICREVQEETSHPTLDITAHYQSVSTRLMKLICLFNRLKDNLQPSTVAFNDAEAAHDMLRGLVQSLEKDICKAELYAEAVNVSSQLESRQNEVRNWTLFIKEGAVSRISKRRGGRILDRHLFLFNDFLVVTDGINTSGKYKVRQEISVHSIELKKSASDNSSAETNHSFRAIGNEHNVEIIFQSEEEMSIWWSAINKAIVKSKERKNSIVSADFKKKAPEWIHDKESIMCMQCGNKFNSFRRRHHCRACGKLVCKKCSDNQAPLPFLDGKLDRVCKQCFEEITERDLSTSMLEKPFESSFEVTEVWNGALLYQDRVNGQESWTNPAQHFCVLNSQSIISVFQRRQDIKPYSTIVTLAFDLTAPPDDNTIVFTHPSASLAYRFTMTSAQEREQFLNAIKETIYSFQGCPDDSVEV